MSLDVIKQGGKLAKAAPIGGMNWSLALPDLASDARLIFFGIGTLVSTNKRIILRAFAICVNSRFDWS
jgi:hypothetical protein